MPLKTHIKEVIAEIVQADPTLQEVDVRITLRRQGSEEEIRELATKVHPASSVDDHEALNLRFFQALEFLIEIGKLSSKKAFAERYEINRGNMGAIKSNASKHAIRPVWLTYLSRDYGVSAEWLLKGEGAIV